MICLILISLAGVRLQSKKDSHCESFFIFGLTPSFSHLMLSPITTTIESVGFFVILISTFTIQFLIIPLWKNPKKIGLPVSD